MKKTILLLLFLCSMAYAYAGPYFTGISQLNNLLAAVGMPTRDTGDNDHNEQSSRDLWNNQDNNSDPSSGWSWQEKNWPASTPIVYDDSSEPNFEYLTGIDWSNGKGNNGAQYVQVADLILQQSAPPDEKNELRLLKTINLSGNRFYNFSFDANNVPRATSSLAIVLSNNVDNSGKTTWQAITVKNFVTSSEVTLDIRNNNLSLAGLAGLALNIQSGVNLLCSQSITKQALFPDVDFSAEKYSSSTAFKFYKEGSELTEGTDYTDNGDGTFTFEAAYENQTISCKLTDPAIPIVDYSADKCIEYTFKLVDDPGELASVAIASTPNSSVIFDGENIQLDATVLNLGGTAANNTTLLWECIPAGAGSFSNTTSAHTVFTPGTTDAVQIKCTATQDISGKVTEKSDMLSFTFTAMPEFVTLNVTGGGIGGDIDAALSGDRIDPSHIRHLRITGNAMSNADCRTIVATFINLVTLDFSAYNQTIPDADEDGVGAFEGLPVKRVKFYENEQTIGSYAFKNCVNLVFARLDRSIVNDGVFEGCTAMSGASFHRDRTAAAIAGSDPFPAGIKIFVSSSNSNAFISALPPDHAENIMNGVDMPYAIATPDELDAVRWFNGGRNFELDNDIDLDEFITDNPDLEIRTYGWYPLGDWNNNFEGVFDGKNHVVSNLWMARAQTDQTANVSIVPLRGNNGVGSTNSYDQKGLIGCNRGNPLAVKNLGVTTKTGKSVRGGGDVGGIVGLINSLSMENCYFIGTVEGTGNTGGLLGTSNSGNTTIVQSFAKANVSCTGADCGGLVGMFKGNNNSCYIKECFFSGSVTGGTQPSGLVGEVQTDNFLIQNCYVTGSVSGTDNVAGIIGKSGNYAAPKVEKCYVTATIIDTSNGSGGVFGNTTSSAEANRAIAVDNFILSDQIKRGTAGSAANTVLIAYGNNGALNPLTTNNKAFDGIEFNGSGSYAPDNWNTGYVDQKTAEEIINWRMDGTNYIDEFDQSGWNLDDVWYRVNGENYLLPVLKSLPLSEQPAETPEWLRISDMSNAQIIIDVLGGGNVTPENGADGYYEEVTGKTVTFTVTPHTGEDLLSFTVNGIEKKDEITAGEYRIVNVFGKNTVRAVFSGLANPGELASVDITPKSSGTFAGEPVQFTATALNYLNAAAENTTFLWTCDPSTAGSFNDATSATPLFTPAIAGNIDITCVATRDDIQKDNTVTIAPVALTSLELIPAPQFFNGIYFQSEAATITFGVKANGTDITRASFLNALTLNDNMVVQDGKLVYTPQTTGSIPVNVSLGSVTATKNLTVYPAGAGFMDKTEMTADASSVDTERSLTADLAIDGDTSTRWAASPTGLNGGNKNQEEWLRIDLGGSYTLNMIQIDWEAAKAAVYEIWVSDEKDGTYTKVGEEINTSNDTDHLIVRTLLENPSGDDVVARFVKIDCQERTANDWNCSIFEVELLGTQIVGFNSVSADGKLIKTEYYDLQGRQVRQPDAKGVYIVKKTFDSGKVTVSKLIKVSNNTIIK